MLDVSEGSPHESQEDICRPESDTELGNLYYCRASKAKARQGTSKEISMSGDAEGTFVS